jgi:hypothetical protein
VCPQDALTIDADNFLLAVDDSGLSPDVSVAVR